MKNIFVDNNAQYATEGALKTYGPEGNLLPAEKAFFTTLNKSARILDAACGGGRTTFRLFEMGFTSIEAFDNQPGLITIAKKHNEEHASCFTVTDLESAHEVYKNKKFDVILISFNGIDYITEEKKRWDTLLSLFQLLTPTGVLLFSSHNNWCINRAYLKVYLKNWRPILRGDHWYVTKHNFGKLLTYFGSPHVIKKELVKRGLNCEVIPNVSTIFPFRDPFPYYKVTKFRA